MHEMNHAFSVCEDCDFLLEYNDVVCWSSLIFFGSIRSAHTMHDLIRNPDNRHPPEKYRAMTTAECLNCGNRLLPDHSGPCPRCGRTGKKVFATMNETVSISDSLNWKSTHEFYEKNRSAQSALIIITVISPLVGLVLVGLWGVLAGLTLGAISYLLGPKAVTKVREIRRG